MSSVKFYYTIGESITFTCDAGLELRGAKMLKCLRNGKWSNAIPTCLNMEQSSTRSDNKEHFWNYFKKSQRGKTIFFLTLSLLNVKTFSYVDYICLHIMSVRSGFKYTWSFYSLSFSVPPLKKMKVWLSMNRKTDPIT